MSILLGKGSGGFTVSSVTVGSAPKGIAIGDFNGDGIQDLAVTNYSSNTISILLGNGSGGFTQAAGSPFSSVGTNPSYIAVGDFNGDGIADLAVSSYTSRNIVIFLGIGSGGFTATGSPISTPTAPGVLVAADFNDDGIADLAVVSGNTNTVSVFLGNGTGNGSSGFTAATGIPLLDGWKQCGRSGGRRFQR